MHPGRLFRAALLGLVVLLPPALAQSVLDFSLINRTGMPIEQLFVSSPASEVWGGDLLGAGTLLPGATIDLRFPPGSADCLWDMKATYRDGHSTEWRNVNLCRIARLSLFFDGVGAAPRAVGE